MPWFCKIFLLILGIQSTVSVAFAAVIKGEDRAPVRLTFPRNVPCTYSYQLSVATGRGSQSLASQGYELHTIVQVTPVSEELSQNGSLHSLRLEVREPRLRRVRPFGRTTTHPVNEELEKKFSKPFYFRQYNHGSLMDAMFPNDDDPQALGFKKGIAGSFQVNLKSASSDTPSKVQEHDDSGVYISTYTTLSSNETDTTMERQWTNHDYLQFADGTPVTGEHKVQFQQQSRVHVKDGRVHKVHRTHKAAVGPAKGHPRAENFKKYEDQDIEMSASGYTKLTLLKCEEEKGHRRSRRSLEDEENTQREMRKLNRGTLIFTDIRKVNLKDGEEKKKFKPFYELIRCFTDKTVPYREMGECAREMHRLVKNDDAAFQKIRRLVLAREHQNTTTWAVLISALAAHGQVEAQDTLAHALRSDYPRRLSNEEYEALLEGIFYLPQGPLHKKLFNALFDYAARHDNPYEHVTMPLLVLAGLVKRAHNAGYNRTLSDSVVELIHHSYRNKSSHYHPDSDEHETHLRNHIYAFGNLGHISGLDVILRHADHDSSGIRAAVVSAMRKLPHEHTDDHLFNALYRDEENDVKAAVFQVFVERHQHLTPRVVKALEHAIWHAGDNDALDINVKEFLENHGSHPQAKHVRSRRSLIRRQKRALFPALRPREFKLGPNKRWVKVFGGKWIGAESQIQFLNQVSLRIGIFGGDFVVNIDNYAKITAHILKFSFDICKGKAAFKASASFKNDIPKELIHAIADAGDDILKGIDSITGIIVKYIDKFKNKLKGIIPLYIDKFVDFVNKLVNFVEDLVKPLRPINLINKIIKFAKDVASRLKNWKWMLDKIRKIQISLNKLTVVDAVFKKVIATLDKILEIINRITLRLPHNLPKNFKIEDLLRWLRSVSVDLQGDKIKEYFKSLGFNVPGGFRLQLPFKFAIKFSFYIDEFTSICIKIVNFGNNYLDLSSIFDALRAIRFPRLKLPELEGKFPSFSGSGFNFGLKFDWRINLRFDLNLKSPGFVKFVRVLEKLVDFFKQFRLPSFDLEKFFKDIMPGKDLDLVKIFKEIFGSSNNGTAVGKSPGDVLRDFINKIIDLLDSKMPNITAISDITDFFKELGPAAKEFAKESVKKVCNVYKFGLNTSRDFKEFGENIETRSIAVLKTVKGNVQDVLQEVMNFTIIVDSLIDEIEKNFTVATRGFLSNSLVELSKSLKDIQALADQVVDFANGTASQVNGVCMRTADFSADIIDEVQNISREALGELQQFIGPVATKVKKFGQELKVAVNKVEQWYTDNLASRVGRISKVSRIIADLMSILNTEKGFLGDVKKIAVKVNDILLNLNNIPDHAAKARKTADDIINFADRAQNFKDEIKKLDLRKQFGIDYDRKVSELCNKFNALASETLDKIGGYDITKEVNSFFTTEADKLISKAVTKFRQIKEPITEVQEELREISVMVDQVMDVLINLKPFSSNLSPILATINRLPDCAQAKKIFLESVKPCVRKASIVGKYVIAQYKDMRKEVKVLFDMIPDTWKSLKIQKCIKGASCISKAFIDQVNVIKDKVEALKDKFKEASGYTEMLETCKAGTDNITAVVDLVKNLTTQIKEFDLRDDVKKIKDVLRSVTGREVEGNEEPDVATVAPTARPPAPTNIASDAPPFEKEKNKIKRIIDYIKKAKETKEKMEKIIENTFKALKTVYDDAILEHTQSIQDVRNKLKLSYELWKKTKDVNTVIRALDTIVKGASDYADNLNDVTSKFSGPVVDLLTETGELSNVVKPHMDKYVGKVTETTAKVNGFLKKVTDFLNKIQLRQKGLDPSEFKPWNSYPFCSESVCLRPLRRSSKPYLDTIFTWKYPHLDDLSSVKRSGRWLIPGLFDDYKVEGIAQLSDSEMLLGMYGVAANEGQASLLVVTDMGRQTVKKIVQLGSPGSPFTVKIGGVAIARDVIWISDQNSNQIYRVNKGDLGGASRPTWAGVSSGNRVEGTASSVSYDDVTNMLWVTDGVGGKGYGYKLSANGDLIGNVVPERTIVIGPNAQGMAIVRQYHIEHVVVSRCVEFQCKLEFHDISGGDEISENTISRVVRTPTGLESVQKATSELLVIVFSSATFSEKDAIERIAGDFEDRYFRIRVPVLKMTFDISENCLYFKVWFDDILPERRLFPYGVKKCGHLRKRSLKQQLLESDVYSDELEEAHSRSKREVGEPPSCMRLFRGNVMRGYHEFYSYVQYIPVFPGIVVVFQGGAGGYYFVDYQGELCMRDKTFKVSLIPGAWISANAGASAVVFIVWAGISIEAVILETYLLPELTVNIEKWPLKACLELKMRMTPLRIRVWLWYRFLLCIRIRCKCFSCSIKIKWCSPKTWKEWWWSARTIERTLFSTCKLNLDKTPPTTGDCVARQAGDKTYFVQWQGFTEDTRITFYRVMIGSIRGSGDDFGQNVGLTMSKVVRGLPIMHGRDVYVSVRATNGAGLDSRLAICPVFKANRQGPRIRYVYDGAEMGKDLDYQSETDFLGANFNWRKGVKDIVDVKWGISSSSSCTLDAREADVYPMTSMGQSLSIQTSGLSLIHGRKYYVRVAAMNKIGLKTVMCSDGITIDTTPPVAGYIFDGAGEKDTDYLPSLKRVRARFESFKDPESPIVKYEWKIVILDSGIDLTSFVNIPLPQRTPLMEGLNLQTGKQYKVILRGTNAAGLHTLVESNGFRGDQTAPLCQNIIDVLDKNGNKDVDFVRQMTSIKAKWSCTDSESGIQSQLIAVGTYPGGEDVLKFDNDPTFVTTLPDGMMFAQISNITIKPAVRYHVTVKVINGAGTKRTLTSNGILVDTTPPSVAAQYIKDGMAGKDLNFTKERFSFSAHWEQAFTDAESSIAEYRFGIGTKPGLVDTQSFVSAGTKTNGTLRGLLLESGRKYYVTVIGCNGVNMCVNASSNGAIVDYVAPHPGKVITGFQGPPQKFQWIKNSVWARWNWCLADEKDFGSQKKAQCANDSFYDIHSGIRTFELSVSFVGNGQPISGFKEVGRVRMSGRTIDLSDGIFSVVVQAKDKAGMAASGLSNTLIVDSTPPVISLIQHGHSGQIRKYTNEERVTFTSYFEIEDDLSKVTAYKVSVGSYSGADDVIGPRLVTLPYAQSYVTANWTSSEASLIENGRKYFITVQAINSAGLFGSKSSDPLISDSEPPKNAIVSDGWGMMDAKYQVYTGIYRAHWQGLSDFSGIQYISLGLSSRPSGKVCDQHPLEKVQGNTNYHVLSGLNLKSGSRYNACLKVVDNSGNEAFFFSDGIVVDSSPPLPGVVADGKSGENIQVQTESSILRANWANFTEKETDIVKYSLAFGTSPGKQDVQEFTDVGLVSNAASSRLKVSELTSGQRYYATVIAFNNLGIPSAAVSSDGVTVDFTPPSFTIPTHDGHVLGTDLSFTRENYLTASWTCEDSETGLKSVEVAFGYQPGKADVLNFTAVHVSQKKFSINAVLRQGYRYFATVRCINNVGLKSLSSSNGVTYDVTPPRGVSINDFEYQNSTNDFSVAFTFVDIESGVQEYHIILHDSTTGTEQGPYILNGSLSSATVHVLQPLISGHNYFVNVTVRNGVGLSSSLISDGFIVDTTPAICSKIWNGGKDLANEIHFIPLTTRLTVSWRCYDIESEIRIFRFAVKDSDTAAFVLPFHLLKAKVNATGTAVLTGNGRWLPRYQEGRSYIIGIEVVNAVNLKTVYWTNPVTVDSSPPVFKNLKLKFNPTADTLVATWKLDDKESGLKSQKWGLGRTPLQPDALGFNSMNKSTRTLTITNSIVPLQLGKTYFIILEASNVADLTSRAVSNGVVIDRTKPTTGVVTAQYVLPPNYDRNRNVVPGTSLTVTWTGFIDLESGIAQYGWAVGTNVQATKILTSQYYSRIPTEDSVGGVVISNFTVTGNVTYFVCIRATNGAGLERTDCSQGMTVILGKFSAGIVKDGPSRLRKDSDFQLDNRAIWAHWDGFKDPVYGISSYEWCIGDKQPISSQKDICKWGYMKLDRLVNKANRFHNLTLDHGTTYYATVKAKNSRGESITSSSDGVVVDRSPPVGGSIKVAPTVGTETLFMTSLAAPTVTWEMEDKESGISHFEIGAGSFPMQDDLLAFTRLNNLDRSVDLDELNFTTSQGQTFYVTITGHNMLGLQTSLTTQQVVVDVTPPEVGTVLDGHGDEDLDYQSNTNRIAAHWRGFADAESDVVRYQWCVGTGQGDCDILSMTSVQLQTSASSSVHLENGKRYYVTVVAENAAGHKQTSFSDGVSVDTSPPVPVNVKYDAPFKLGGKDLQSDGRKIAVSWDKIVDKESGLASLSWCAGNASGQCDIVGNTALDVNEDSLVHSLEKPLTSGASVFITLTAVNGAGGSSQMTSNELVIDTTAPTVGGVSVGNSIGKKYLKKDETLKADWGGFQDLESGLNRYEFAVCIASSSNKCITPFMNIGLQTSFENDGLDLKPGVCYMIVVRAYNKANLYSESKSNLFTLEDEGPVPGTVLDGSQIGRDISMQGSTTTISANWEPFTDRNSRVSKYEICVGDAPSVCNVAPFQVVRSMLSGSITGLNLQHKTTYYVTVKATNEAGYSSMAFSNGVMVDSTPPVGGGVRDGRDKDDVDFQSYDSFISASWDEFHDTESGIEKYVWCAGTIQGSCDVVGETAVRNRRQVSLQVSPPLSSGMTVYVTVSGINGVGEKTTVHSDGVQIDSTPPLISKVNDLQTNTSLDDKDYLTSKTEYCASWNVDDDESGLLKSEVEVCTYLDTSDCLLKWTEVGNRTLICMSNLELIEGVEYVTKVRVTNNVGLRATKSSDGFIVDSSPPMLGDIEHTENVPNSPEGSPQRFTSSGVSVRWHGFWDKESAVEKYFICLGTKPDLCDVKNYVMVQGTTSYAFKGLSLIHNTMYFVSIAAENSAGLRSKPMSSDGVLMDLTAPKHGSPIYDGKKEGQDIDYQQSDREITANWKRFDDPESDVVKVEWCAGTKPGACDVFPSTKLLPWITSIHEVLDKPMPNGQRFYVTVRARNGAGAVTNVSSNGVTIDTTPPIIGLVVDGTGANDADYNGEEVVTARWQGFEDSESPIASYEAAICEAKNISSCPQPYTSVNLATNIAILGLDLDSGTMYIVKLRVTNMAGLQSEAESDGFTMDFSPPIPRAAWIGSSVKEEKYLTDNTSVTVRWQPFSDPESGILKYEVCMGTLDSECNIKDFVSVGVRTSFTITGLDLKNGNKYRVTVRGTNRVGLKAETKTKPALVDVTPPAVVDPINDLNNTNPSNDTDSSPYVRFSCTEEFLNVDWDEFEDPESDLLEYTWCVGKGKGLCDVVSMRGVALRSNAQAITEKVASGTALFARVNVVNKGGLVTSLLSKQCVVITAAPRVLDVIDLDSMNSTNMTDIDWKASMKSLTLKWQLLGNFLSDISRVKLQVAVTQPSSKESFPKLDESKSWKGEPFAQDFMDVSPSDSKVTIQSLDLQPWEEYRGVVRAWNEGEIFAEGSTDGIRLEPRAPLPRRLILRDNAPEKERKRWLPRLRLPAVNVSLIDEEVIYISSPADISVDVTTGVNMTNSSIANETLARLDDGKFSPTKEFQLLAFRVTSIDNSTNTTEDTETMKWLPGIANPEGPCCMNHTTDSQTRYTDTHFKPTVPAYNFGSSVVFLSNGYAAAGAVGKAFVFSTKQSSSTHKVVQLTNSGGFDSVVKVETSSNKIVFITDGVIQIHKYSHSSDGSLTLQRQTTISNCVANPCSADIKWSRLVGAETAINGDTLVTRGRLAGTNKGIVGVFRQTNGIWRLLKEIGQTEQDVSFGESLAINSRMIAVTRKNGKFVKLYSKSDQSVITTVDLSKFSVNMTSTKLRLTDANTLIAISKDARTVIVIDINVITKSHIKVCQYSPPPETRLSGNADYTSLNDGTMLVLGMQTLNGRDGVLLVGFHGSYQYHPDSSRNGRCVQLARIDSRENHFRVDDGVPRATVAVQGSKIIFGTPGVLTLPGQSERRGTGRVYMSTYCPRNFVRSRVSQIGLLDTHTCKPCVHGGKSFGGYSTICLSCQGRRCAYSNDDDPIHFSTDLCDHKSCSYAEEYDNKTGGVKIQQENGTFFAEGGHFEFTLKLIETTRADMSTTSMSESFIIDTTPPEIGIIYDGIGGDRSSNCSVNKTFGGEGGDHCTTSDFEETDIDFTNNTSEVHARWIDFQDKESDIVEYFWCLGSQPIRDDIRECESTGMRPNGSHYGLNFQQGDKYFVTVVACNNARRCSAASSNGVIIDTTPPVMHYVRDGVLGPDIDYQVFVDIVFAYFKGSDADSGIASYEVGWGTSLGLADIHPYEEIGNITTWYAKFKDNALKRKHRYYASVRATNKAGLMSEPMSSNGVVVGKSEYIFDKNGSASFFFDTVNMNVNGTRKDGGVGKTYGTLDVPEGAVKDEVKLRCYSLDKKDLKSNKSDDGPVSNPNITRPKQFMLGNYSFQIKAVDPINNTAMEGYRFVKPIKISMFYDVDNLVNANKRTVNKEVKKEDIDPVLYLWDPKNKTWMDASLTCPEPWYHVNRTIKLLTLNICHLTQFAFFWSFKAQKGLMMFEKNDTLYNEAGEIEINRTQNQRQIHLPIKRSKGAMGNIEVLWSLFNNRSSDTKDLIWPTSGVIRLKESQWNATLTLNVAGNDVETKERVIWVTLDNTTGGAVLASRDLTSSKIIIGSNFEESYTTWIIIGVCCGVLMAILVGLLVYGLRRRRRNKDTTRSSTKRGTQKLDDEIPMASGDADTSMVQSEISRSPKVYRLPQYDDKNDGGPDSAVEDETPPQRKRASKKKRKFFSLKKSAGDHAIEEPMQYENPVYGEIRGDPSFFLSDFNADDGPAGSSDQMVDGRTGVIDDEKPKEERYVDLPPLGMSPRADDGNISSSGDELDNYIDDRATEAKPLTPKVTQQQQPPFPDQTAGMGNVNSGATAEEMHLDGI